MRLTPKGIKDKKGIKSKKNSHATGNGGGLLYQQAFDHSLQANFISIESSGKIILANSAACQFLGYSEKEILSKKTSAIFNTGETSFKQMLKVRDATGKVSALVTVIKKDGKHIPCEISSAIFVGEHGLRKSIISITDRSESILIQKKIDSVNKKIVADNIVIAKLKQKGIDVIKEKIVSDNIAIAKSKQKGIDVRKEKIVSDNIVLAKSKQDKIDIKNQKLVEDNIALALEKSDARLAENNEWIKYIAKASYDVMWDWDVATGEIYVGDSIEEVFGYKVENNIFNFEDFMRNLLDGKKAVIQKKLLKKLAGSDKSWDDSFLFRRRDGSFASTFSRASIMRDEKGKAIRLIGAIQDVSRLEELERKVIAQSILHKKDRKKLRMIAQLSFDVIWDWNLLTDEVFIGEGFEELLGYKIKNNKSTRAEWNNYVHPDDKRSLEKGISLAVASSNNKWEHTYRLVKADGSFVKIFDKGSIIRHPGGKAFRIIGAMQDLNRRRDMEDKLHLQMAVNDKLLTQFKEGFKLIFNSSSDILYDCDLVSNKIIISDAFEKEFGYKITTNMRPVEDWLSHAHPGDKSTLIDDYKRTLASNESKWKQSYRFLKADTSVADILSSAIILRDTTGKAYRMIGSMQDISKQKVLEERLEDEIKLKEKQIEDAMDDAKGTERSEIGKELHDNVNQLLGASKLYLEMAKQGGANTKSHLSRSSEYTISAIDAIRRLTKGLTSDTIKNLGLCTAIENVARDTMEINPVKIYLDLNGVAEQGFNDKFKLNIFRIIQEQLNNILKHAQASEITISLTQNDISASLIISDNGVGFDTGEKQNGIGIANIKSRAVSFNGKADFVSKPGSGCALNVIFPVINPLLKES